MQYCISPCVCYWSVLTSTRTPTKNRGSWFIHKNSFTTNKYYAQIPPPTPKTSTHPIPYLTEPHPVHLAQLKPPPQTTRPPPKKPAIAIHNKSHPQLRPTPSTIPPPEEHENDPHTSDTPPKNAHPLSPFSIHRLLHTYFQKGRGLYTGPA